MRIGTDRLGLHAFLTYRKTVTYAPVGCQCVEDLRAPSLWLRRNWLTDFHRDALPGRHLGLAGLAVDVPATRPAIGHFRSSDLVLPHRAPAAGGLATGG